MATDTNQPLQAWTCAKCGAALPAEAATGAVVTCGYCGTPFSLPTAQTRRGGVTISGESITIGGDIVGGSKRVIVTSEALSAATIWNEPDTDDTEGVSIEGDGIQVHGDVVGGSVVQIVRPAPLVKAEPVAAVQMELALATEDEEKPAAPETVVRPVAPIEPEVMPAAVPQLGWWTKLKRLFSN